MIAQIDLYVRDDAPGRAVLEFLLRPDPPAVKPFTCGIEKPCCANRDYQSHEPRSPEKFAPWTEADELVLRVSRTNLQCQCRNCCYEIIELMTQAVKTVAMDDDSAHAFRAKAHWLLGNDEQALHDARQAVGRRVNSWYGNAVLGMILFKRKQYAEALPRLETSWKRNYPHDEINSAIATCREMVVTATSGSEPQSA